MSHLLYFWRGDNYRRDLDFGVGFHLNQSSPKLHRVEPGESLWAFTRRRDGLYVLAAELVVKARTLNPRQFRYGRYRVWGDLERSRYFSTAGQPDITSLVRSMSITARGHALGSAFQGSAAVREILANDHQLLREYARDLPLEPRARLLPEERLEALLLAGDKQAVDRLLQAEGAGLAADRQRYLMTRAGRRDSNLVQRLRSIYDGVCQVSGWNPRQLYGVDLCETHHIRWLSRGGQDEITNMVLLAPNIHRVIHRLDAPFDWERHTFLTEHGEITIARSEHDLAAE